MMSVSPFVEFEMERQANSPLKATPRSGWPFDCPFRSLRITTLHGWTLVDIVGLIWQ
jgi:hypothetical protein